MERTEINERIYKNVKALAKSKGIKLQDVANRAGVAIGYISRKQKNISVECLMRFAEIFDVKMEDLVNKNFESELEFQIIANKFRNAVREMLRFQNRAGVLDSTVRALDELGAK